MRFTETDLSGVWVIDIEPFKDDRGFFATTWVPEEFARHGLDASLAQCNLAWNARRGTIRGMHFQRPPFDEVKIVRCTRGAILDIVVDLRADSPTFCQWVSFELTADNRRMLYVPRGMAHGYQTLTDDVEAYYHVSAPYSPSHASGVRWDDPRFGIAWPMTPTVISERDKTWPDFVAA